MFFSSCKYTAVILLSLIPTSVCPGAVKLTRSQASALRTLPAQGIPGVISIRYDLVPLGGNVYRYVYSITNTGQVGSVVPVQLFDILFDVTLYREVSLQIVSPGNIRSDWSEQLLVSLPGVPAAYDALALRGGIPAGSTVTGFSVQFVWLGSGVPGSQPFQIFDPTTFLVVQTGQTVGSPAPAGAPAASTVSLILIGIGLTLTGAYQARAYNRRVPVGVGTVGCDQEARVVEDD